MNLSKQEIENEINKSSDCTTCKKHVSTMLQPFKHEHSCQHMKNTKITNCSQLCPRPSGCIIRGWYEQKELV